MAAPIQILNINSDQGDGDGNLYINEAALLSIFDKVGDLPFACISISGKKRQGKSFMMGYFLRYLASPNPNNGDWMNLNIPNAFHWRGTGVRDTSGINIWSEPFKYILPDGREVAILLIDTQGSFDDETSMQQDAQIFAWSTLLSSVLVFNVMKDIGEDVFQFLQFFVSYASLAMGADDSPEDTECMTGIDAFQKLIFLVRDMQFSDYKFGFYDDHNVPEDQVANFKTNFIDSKPNQVSEIRFTHEQITKCFNDIGVYALPDPGRGLMRQDRTDDLDLEFTKHVAAFVQLVFDPKNIVTKKVGGMEVTGKQFKTFISKWTALFKRNDLPELKNIFSCTADAQYAIAKSIAISFYRFEMEKFMQANPDGVPEKDLTDKGEVCSLEASAMFKSRRKLGGKEYENRFNEEFLEETQRFFQMYVQMNHTSSKSTALQKDFELKRSQMQAEIDNDKRQIEEIRVRNERERQHLQNEINQGTKELRDLQVLINQQEREAKIREEHQLELDRLRQKQIEDLNIQYQAALNKPPVEVHHHHGDGGGGCTIA